MAELAESHRNYRTSTHSDVGVTPPPTQNTTASQQAASRTRFEDPHVALAGARELRPRLRLPAHPQRLGNCPSHSNRPLRRPSTLHYPPAHSALLGFSRVVVVVDLLSLALALSSLSPVSLLSTLPAIFALSYLCRSIAHLLHTFSTSAEAISKMSDG